MKLITVLDRSYVLTSRGKCLGPIYPFLESRDHILAMIARGLDVYEVIGTNGVKLTLDNIDNDNSESKPDVIFVQTVTLDQDRLELLTGKSAKLTHTIDPSDATNTKVSWTTDNNKVATVVDGLVSAKAKGSTTIKVVTEDGNKEAKCTVVVTDPVIKVQSISLNDRTLELEVDGERVLAYTINPSNATNTKVSWTSDQDGIATVIDGTVLAISEGQANIKVITEDGSIEDTCVVTVKAPQVPDVEDTESEV